MDPDANESQGLAKVRPRKPRRLKCWSCGKYGHLSKYCIDKKKSGKEELAQEKGIPSEPKKCWKCGNAAHGRTKCPMLIQKREPPKKNLVIKIKGHSMKPETGHKPEEASLECYSCHRFGHKARNCPESKKKIAQKYGRKGSMELSSVKKRFVVKAAKKPKMVEHKGKEVMVKGRSFEKKSYEPMQRRARTLFPPYLSMSEMLVGIEEGRLVKGCIRINPKRSEDAYVTVNGLRNDIYLDGRKARNRSLEGDEVCVKLYPPSFWRNTNSAQEQQLEVTSVISASDNSEPIAETKVAGTIADLKIAEAKDSNIQGTAVVVGIIRRSPSYEVTGILEPPEGRSESFTFVPFDKRVPKMLVFRVLKSLQEDPQSCIGRLVTVKIDSWPHTSRMPRGSMVEDLGITDSVEVQTIGLLRESGIVREDFPNDVENEAHTLAELRDINLLVKNDRPEVRRRDLRKEFPDLLIFSIDPATARDIDDALSIRRVENGWEVGVHIADVSSFVSPSGRIDEEARRRCTSVYLVQRVISMLPRILCEDLCSLNADVPRAAFSVFWTLSENAEVLSEWFGKTIIQSCAKLAYSHAQAVIEGDPSAITSIVDHIALSSDKPKHELSELATGISSSITNLWRLSKQLRRKRYENGALSLNNVKIRFELDEDMFPVAFYSAESKEANHLVEEFMLLANISVARKILLSWPSNALLRRHPPPKERMVDVLTDDLYKMANLRFDSNSAASIAESIQSCARTMASKNVDQSLFEPTKLVLEKLCTKPMQLALYFCSGGSGQLDDIKDSDFHHFALNVGYYTHFTSPIRRYADIVVHRLLYAALAKDVRRTVFSVFFATFSHKFQAQNLNSDFEKLSLDSETLLCPISTQDCHMVTQKCNERKLAARTAQDGSSRLFLAYLLKGKAARCEAYVQLVTDRAMVVLVAAFGIECKLFYEDLPWCADSMWVNEKDRSKGIKLVLGENPVLRKTTSIDKTSAEFGGNVLILGFMSKIMVDITMKDSTGFIDIEYTMCQPEKLVVGATFESKTQQETRPLEVISIMPLSESADLLNYRLVREKGKAAKERKRNEGGRRGRLRRGNKEEKKEN